MSKIYLLVFLSLAFPIFVSASFDCEALFNGSKSRALFEDPTHILDSFYQPDGSQMFLRKTKIGLPHKLIFLSVNPIIIIRDLQIHLRNKEFSFWLQGLMAIKQLYFMPPKQFRRLFPGMRRSYANLYKMLNFFQVQLSLSHELTDNLSWVSENSLGVHFKKHGPKEFNSINAEEYLKMAKNFILTNNGFFQIVLKIRGNTFLKYDAITFEVAIIENGFITTYFKLTEDYRRQNEFDFFIGKLLAEGLVR